MNYSKISEARIGLSLLQVDKGTSMSEIFHQCKPFFSKSNTGFSPNESKSRTSSCSSDSFSSSSTEIEQGSKLYSRMLVFIGSIHISSILDFISAILWFTALILSLAHWHLSLNFWISSSLDFNFKFRIGQTGQSSSSFNSSWY